jgi:hypothetical protein
MQPWKVARNQLCHLIVNPHSPMKTKSLACLAVLLLAATAEARVKLVALPDRDRVVISLANQNGTLVEEERVLTLQKGVIPISNPTAMKSAALLPLAAAEPERQLAFKEAKKQQVRHSILGPRDTLPSTPSPKKAPSSSSASATPPPPCPSPAPSTSSPPAPRRRISGNG